MEQGFPPRACFYVGHHSAFDRTVTTEEDELISTRESVYGGTIAGPGTLVRAGVGVVIRDTHRWVLLEKRSDCGLWGLPGGRIEPGESVMDTAVRETLEETGLHVRVTGLIGVYSSPNERIVTYPDNVVQLVDIVVEAEIVTGMLTPSTESQELRFFDAAHPPDDLVPPARQPLKDIAAGTRGTLG